MLKAVSTAMVSSVPVAGETLRTLYKEQKKVSNKIVAIASTNTCKC